MPEIPGAGSERELSPGIRGSPENSVFQRYRVLSVWWSISKDARCGDETLPFPGRRDNGLPESITESDHRAEDVTGILTSG